MPYGEDPRKKAYEDLSQILGGKLQDDIDATQESLEELNKTFKEGTDLSDEQVRKYVGLVDKLDKLTDSYEGLKKGVKENNTEANQFLQRIDFLANRITSSTRGFKDAALQIASYNQQFVNSAQKMRDFQGRTDAQVRSLDGLRKSLKLTNAEFADMVTNVASLSPAAAIDGLDKIADRLIAVRGHVQGLADFKELLSAEGSSPGLLNSVSQAQQGDQGGLRARLTSGGITADQRISAVVAASKPGSIGESTGVEAQAAEVRQTVESINNALPSLFSDVSGKLEGVSAGVGILSTMTSQVVSFVDLSRTATENIEKLLNGNTDSKLSNIITELQKSYGAQKDIAAAVRTSGGGGNRLDLDDDMRSLGGSGSKKSRSKKVSPRTGRFSSIMFRGRNLAGRLAGKARSLAGGLLTKGNLFAAGAQLASPYVAAGAEKFFGKTAGGIAGGALSGGAQGAALGTLFAGPAGGAIGGTLGAVGGAAMGALQDPKIYDAVAGRFNYLNDKLGAASEYLTGVNVKFKNLSMSNAMEATKKQFEELTKSDPAAALVQVVNGIEDAEKRLNTALTSLGDGIEAKAVEIATKRAVAAAYAGKGVDSSGIMEKQGEKISKFRELNLSGTLAQGTEGIQKLETIRGSNVSKLDELRSSGASGEEVANAEKELKNTEDALEAAKQKQANIADSYKEVFVQATNASGELEKLDQQAQETLGYTKQRMQIAMDEAATFDVLAGDYSKITEATKKNAELLEQQKQAAAASVAGAEKNIDNMKKQLEVEKATVETLEKTNVAGKNDLDIRSRKSAIEAEVLSIAEEEAKLVRKRAEKASEIVQAEKDNLNFQQQALDAASSLNKVLNTRSFRQGSFEMSTKALEQSRAEAQKGVVSSGLSQATQFGSADQVKTQYTALGDITDKILASNKEMLSIAQQQAEAAQDTLKEEEARVRLLQSRAKASGDPRDDAKVKEAEASYLKQMETKVGLLNKVNELESQIISQETERRDLELKKAKEVFSKRTMQLDTEKFMIEQNKDMAEFMGASYPEILKLEQQNIGNMRSRLKEVDELVSNIGAGLSDEEKSNNAEYQQAIQQQVQLRNDIKKNEMGTQRNFLDKALGAMFGVGGGSKAQPLMTSNREVAGGSSYVVGRQGEVIPTEGKTIPRASDRRRFAETPTADDPASATRDAFVEAKEVANQSKDAFAALRTFSEQGIALNVAVTGLDDMVGMKITALESRLPVLIRQEINNFATKPA